MRNVILLMVLVALAATVGNAAIDDYYGDTKTKSDKTGLLSVLKPGQKVILSQCSGSYELTISNTTILSKYKVAKVADDFVILTSKPKLLEIRIPVTSIRAIIHLKR
jgi:hypothetical protein